VVVFFGVVAAGRVVLGIDGDVGVVVGMVAVGSIGLHVCVIPVVHHVVMFVPVIYAAGVSSSVHPVSSVPVPSVPVPTLVRDGVTVRYPYPIALSFAVSTILIL
jgi:hypothetical protein